VVNYLFWNFIVEAEVLLKVFKQVLEQVLGQWVMEKEQVLKEQPYLLELEIALCQGKGTSISAFRRPSLIASDRELLETSMITRAPPI